MLPNRSSTVFRELYFASVFLLTVVCLECKVLQSLISMSMMQVFVLTLFCRSSGHAALSVKRLWQYLVKQEEVQETFIRNIFTKKRCLNEVGMVYKMYKMLQVNL